MDEILFVVTEAPEGGSIARALGQGFFTEADDLPTLRGEVRDAVRCHFEEGQAPRVVRLHSALSTPHYALPYGTSRSQTSVQLAMLWPPSAVRTEPVM
jgi:hypothetical protein